MKTSGTRRSSSVRIANASELEGCEPSLDLGPLPTVTGFVLRRTQLAVFADFISTFEPLGLRPAQFSVLLVIHRNPGRKQSEIAAVLGIRQANLVGLIDELDRRGLTRRRRLSADRRSHAVTLAAKGEALLKKALALQEEYEASLIARMGPSQHERLLSLLRKLNLVLRPESSATTLRTENMRSAVIA